VVLEKIRELHQRQWRHAYYTLTSGANLLWSAWQLTATELDCYSSAEFRVNDYLIDIRLKHIMLSEESLWRGKIRTHRCWKYNHRNGDDDIWWGYFYAVYFQWKLLLASRLRNLFNFTLDSEFCSHIPIQYFEIEYAKNKQVSKSRGLSSNTTLACIHHIVRGYMFNKSI